MRFFLLTIVLMAAPLAVSAMEAPAAQIPLDAGKVLRGRFVEEHQMTGVEKPMQSSGAFVVAPARGLIWTIEKPFPTATIITPNGAAQDFGGIAIKLPVKNLRHLYDVIGAALAGDWHGLEADFILSGNGNASPWQMLLTPRPGGKPKLPYATITVSGHRFVENIVLTKTDGTYDALSFTDAVLSSAPITANESVVFNEVKP